jgi:hypothetical protein
MRREIRHHGRAKMSIGAGLTAADGRGGESGFA